MNRFRIVWIAFLWVLATMALAQGNIVKEIEIRGLKRTSRDFILPQLSLKVGTPYTDEKRISDEAILQDFGLFEARITGVPLETVGNVTNWRVVIDITEFEMIKEIRVSGNKLVSTQDILKLLPPGLQPGKIFNRKEELPAARAINALYAARGHGRAQIQSVAPLEDSPETVNIEIAEQQFGTVSVQTNPRRETKDWVFKRLIRARPGDPFSQEVVRNDIRRLVGTQWFRVEEPIFSDGADFSRNLTYVLREERTGNFNVGLQVDPRSSFAGVLSFTKVNLGGTGTTVGVNYLQATVGGGPSVDAFYQTPFADAKDTNLRFSVFSRVLFRFQGALFGQGQFNPGSDGQYTERRTGGSLSLARPLDDFRTASAALRLEQVRTDSISDGSRRGAAFNNVIQQDGQVIVGTLGYTVNRRDYDLDPSRGSLLQFTVEPGYTNLSKVGGLTGVRSLLGPNYFTRVILESRQYFSKGPPRGLDPNATRTVLAWRTRFGTILGDVPFFEQLFAGGDDSIRGYLNDRFWGRNMFVSNLEYRVPIPKSAVSVIGFVDYGGAWGGFGSINNFTQSRTARFQLGYGPGISFRVPPLGTFQFYLGFSPGGGSRTHLLIGNSF